MDNISLVRYSPLESDVTLTDQVIECYRNVFSDDPWNEWLQCPVCKKYWGIKDKDFLKCQNFMHCNVTLVDFWSVEQVRKDLYHEIIGDSSCWLAMLESKVVGFCWGYPISVTELEKKLGSKIDFQLIHNPNGSEKVAYQDEVGVLSEYRGKKIAKALVRRRLFDFLAQNLSVGIVRTRESPKPSETFLWYKKLGYVDLANYPDGRVILGRRLDGLVDLL